MDQLKQNITNEHHMKYDYSYVSRVIDMYMILRRDNSE